MKEKCQSCASCGMPLEKSEDYALGDTSQAYCVYCTDAKGQLLPFEKILKANANYYVESQGITPDAAMKMATDLLKNQPAWKNL
jgi:hypothetical protein